MSARFHQCRFQLRHPETNDLVKKGTPVQTSSIGLCEGLNRMKCNGQHNHAGLEGHRRFKGVGINVARFAAFYLTAMAKYIAKIVLNAPHSHGCNVGKVEPRDSVVYPLLRLGELEVEPKQNGLE